MHMVTQAEQLSVHKKNIRGKLGGMGMVSAAYLQCFCT